MTQLVDLTGRKIHSFTVLRITERRGKRGELYWLCRCSCGKEIEVLGVSLRHDHTKSCGCERRERIGAAVRRHGRTRTPEYDAWADMIGRCHRPSHKRFEYYGARGITVCKDWRGRGGFERFLEHVGLRPRGADTIDRIETEGHYAPGNVRWTTWKTQNRNRRSTVMITIAGRTAPLGQWAEESGISYDTLKRRHYLRWPAERLLAPVG